MEIDSTPLGLHALTKAACAGWFICYVHDILGGILASNTACRRVNEEARNTVSIEKNQRGNLSIYRSLNDEIAQIMQQRRQSSIPNGKPVTTHYHHHLL